MTIFLFPLGIALLTLWRPRLALAAVILGWPLYLLRGDIAGIPTTALELMIYALAVAIGVLVFSKRFSWHWVRMTKWSWIFLGAWVSAWVIATFFSLNQEASLGAMKAWLLDALLFAAIVGVVIQTPQDRLFIVKSAILSGLSVAVAGLVQFSFFRDTLQDGRLSSYFLPVANYAAMYLGPLLIITLGLLLFGVLSRRWWAVVVILSVAQLLTLSYGGFLAVGSAAVFLWFFLPSSLFKKRLAFGAGIAALAFILFLSTTNNFDQHFRPDRSSGAVRTQIWVTSWALIKQHPLTGIGPNTFEQAYRKELPKHYYPPLEWLVAQPHNLVLALWLHTGLLGLVSFLAMFGYHFVYVWRTFLSRAQDRGTALASLAGLLAIIIHGFVDTPYFKNDLALIFVFVALLPWLGQRQQEKK